MNYFLVNVMALEIHLSALYFYLFLFLLFLFVKIF